MIAECIIFLATLGSGDIPSDNYLIDNHFKVIVYL